MDVDDSALAVALASRDPRGLDGVYRRYADRLHAYARTIVGDREAAADVVHDTFLLASQHAGRLRDPNRLRPWLYAIARNEGLRQIRHRSRVAPLEYAGDMPADLVDPVTGVHRSEIVDLVRTAAAGLSDADRETIELAIRHGLEAVELAAVLGVSVNHVHARLSRARAQLTVALGVLLVARARPDCAELNELLSGWDGTLTPLLRKRLHRHIDSCDVCADVQRDRLAPAALLTSYGALPFLPVLVPLLDTQPALELVSSRSPTEPSWTEPRWDADTGFPRAAARRSLSKATMAVAAAALIVVLLLVLNPPIPASQQQSSPQLPLAPAGPSSAPPAEPSATAASPTDSAQPSPQPSAPSHSIAPSAQLVNPVASPSPSQQPLIVTATATQKCTGPYAYDWTIKASASAALSSATLHWQVNIRRRTAMTVIGNQATKSYYNSKFTKITWWVVAVSTDGRTTQTEVQTLHNTYCTPPA